MSINFRGKLCQVVDLRGGIQLPAGFSLEVGIQNLFDQNYAEHLNRRTVLTAGDLAGALGARRRLISLRPEATTSDKNLRRTLILQ